MVPCQELADRRSANAPVKSGARCRKEEAAVERRQAARSPSMSVDAERRKLKERLPALRLPHLKKGGDDKEGLASLKVRGRWCLSRARRGHNHQHVNLYLSNPH